MKEDFVTYEQAKTLKELGFDWECNQLYHAYDPNNIYESLYTNHNCFKKSYSAPTLAQAQKWFYKNHNIWIEISDYSKLNPDWGYKFTIITPTDDGEASKSDYNDPFEALSAGINIVLELLKTN